MHAAFPSDALTEYIEALVDEKVAAIQPASPEREWFTVQAAAEYLNVSKRTIESLVASGELRSSFVGSRIIRRSSLDDYAERRST